MSIINDALKKAQKNLHSNNSRPDFQNSATPSPQQPSAPEPTSSPISQQPIKDPRTAIFVLVSLGIIFGILGFLLIRQLMTAQHRSATTAIQQLSVARTAIQTQKPIQPPAPPSASISESAPTQKDLPKIPALSLGGVMTMGDKKIALINGEPYEAGDEISPGIILKEITLKTVIFEQNGQLIEMKITGSN